MKPSVIILAAVMIMVGGAGWGQDVRGQTRLGTYICIVNKIDGDGGLAGLWINGRLRYNADEGTMDGTFDPAGDLAPAGQLNPYARLFSRLRVSTGPWAGNHLTAVQFDPADPPNVRPVVVWFQIRNMTGKSAVKFKIFNSAIGAIASGTCRSQ